MNIQVTFRVSASSKDEMINTFGAQYREFREYVEQLQKTGQFPQDIAIRWVIVTGRWD